MHQPDNATKPTQAPAALQLKGVKAAPSPRLSNISILSGKLSQTKAALGTWQRMLVSTLRQGRCRLTGLASLSNAEQMSSNLAPHLPISRSSHKIPALDSHVYQQAVCAYFTIPAGHLRSLAHDIWMVCGSGVSRVVQPKIQFLLGNRAAQVSMQFHLGKAPYVFQPEQWKGRTLKAPLLYGTFFVDMRDRAKPKPSRDLNLHKPFC